MASKYTEYHVQLINARTGSPIDDDSGVVYVLTAGSSVRPSIYSNDTGTTLANPFAMTDGEISFYTVSTTSSVDITFNTANGESVFVAGLTPSQHRVEVDTERTNQMMVIPWSISVDQVSIAVSTGFILPNYSVVREVFLGVDVLATTLAGEFHVGTSTDPDGFITGAIASVTGLNIMSEQAVVTVNQAIGTLLLGSVASGYVRSGYVPANSTGGRNIVWNNLTATTTVGSGYIYVQYDRLLAGP